LATFLYVIFGTVLIIILYQVGVWFTETRLKNRQCEKATEYCRQHNRLLLVAGGPWGGRNWRRRLNMPAHISGDVNVDIKASAIIGHPNAIVANVIKLPFPDKTFGAAFASHLLEHLPDAEQARVALTELKRVSDVVYIAYPSRQSVVAWLIPDHHLWVWQKNNTVFLKSRNSVKNLESIDI
jgi:hypothetical protein